MEKTTMIIHDKRYIHRHIRWYGCIAALVGLLFACASMQRTPEIPIDAAHEYGDGVGLTLNAFYRAAMTKDREAIQLLVAESEWERIFAWMAVRSNYECPTRYELHGGNTYTISEDGSYGPIRGHRRQRCPIGEARWTYHILRYEGLVIEVIDDRYVIIDWESLEEEIIK